MLFVEKLLCPDGTDDFPSDGSLPAAAFHTLFLAFHGFFSGGPAHAPVTLPGRLILLAMGFFVLVSVAGYTGAWLMTRITRQRLGHRPSESPGRPGSVPESEPPPASSCPPQQIWLHS